MPIGTIGRLQLHVIGRDPLTRINSLDQFLIDIHSLRFVAMQESYVSPQPWSSDRRDSGGVHFVFLIIR
jgi:hypothetical protein